MTELCIVIPIIHTAYIRRCLETLYKYTDPALFQVIVVDQSVDGMDPELIKKYVHLYLKPYRNLGFAKAANEGFIHAVRWGVPYIGVLNDDTEFMNAEWWSGVKEEFKSDPRILAVSPESPRVPLWGYGRDHGEYLDIIPYKEEFSEEDYQYLLAGHFEDLDERIPNIPASFPRHKEGVIDGIAMWFPIFKRESFEKVGYFDEKFFPGGGEDYSLNARAYSCAWPIERDECDETYHYRMVSSMRSWVFHFWGKSKDVDPYTQPAKLDLLSERRWNNLDQLWPAELNQGHKFDLWGHYKDSQDVRRPLKRVKEVHIEPL